MRIYILMVVHTNYELQKFIYIMSKLLSECSRCGSPVTDSLETEIEQHGKVVISTKMDVSYPAILIGTRCGMLRLKKAHMMAYDMQLKDFTTMYDEEAISKMV